MAFNKYPYTDFHEMNDDWVIGKVKELIAAWVETKSDWQQVQSDWVDQQQAFDDLKSFVETYFAELDVQNEINSKLDAMAADGTLGELMQPYIDSAVGDSVPATVSAWLSEHVDPDTGYVIDDSLTISGAAADAKTAGDLIRANASNIKHINGVIPIEYTAGQYIETTNPLTMDDGHPVPTGSSAAWKCAWIACNPGDVFTINGASNNANLRGWHFVTSIGAYISQSANPFSVDNDLILTAPDTAAFLVLNSNDLDAESYIGKILPKQFDDVYSAIDDRITSESYIINSYSNNVKDIEISDKTFVNAQMLSGTVQSTTVRKSVICKIVPNTYVRIKKLQSVYCAIGFTSTYPNAGVICTAYSSFSGIVNTDIGKQAGSNDHYMIATYYTSGQDSSTAAEMESAMHIYYSTSEYGTYEMIAHADNHMVNLLKYRPVGNTKKAYIALSCDDGNAALATYTIPTIEGWASTYGQNIPVTFGLMDNSGVFSNNTYKQLVIDAVTDYGCAMAIHGAQSYLLYPTRKQLMDYIIKQDNYLYDTVGVKPNAVIYPEHQYNDFIQTFCGSLYNACGCGGIKYNYVYRDTADRPFYIGEKSNCYEIYRLAIHDTRITSTDDVEDIIDYAYDNHYIICPYWHDVDLSDDAPNKDYLRGILNKFVEYGMSKGIEFIKLGDIPTVL